MIELLYFRFSFNDPACFFIYAVAGADGNKLYLFVRYDSVDYSETAHAKAP